MSGPGIKKIITIGSSILAILIFLHLIGVYIFAGGYYEGVKGGSISIGIVSPPPNPVNPFEYGTDATTDLIYRFLFRSIVRYDMTNGIYVGDLMNCDLSDMTTIHCTLRDDAMWSDGTRIKTDDVVASIDAFKKLAKNENIRHLLETVTVTKNGDTINIKASQKSPYMIEILTYPIMKASLIDAIQNGTITAKNYITSGPYGYGEMITDREYGFDRITLIRNEKSARIVWLDKINFKFFKDLPSLERSTETLTIVIPPSKNENLEIGPRFREYPYTNYEYFGVFFNTKTMSRILRNSLHWQIGTSFSGNIIPDHKRVDTIFQSGGALLPTENLKGFSDILRELGYTKKTEILSKIEQSSTIVSGEAVYDVAKYWNNKTNVTTIFIEGATDELVLTGKLPTNTQSVSINGYTLQEFIPGNTTFAYKVTTASGTIHEGKNTYTLLIHQGEGKTDTETLTLYTSADTTKIAEYKKQAQDLYNATQNTPALIALRERTKAEDLKKTQSLQDEYYYNDKNEIFQVRIGYSTGPQSTETYANNIDAALRLLGVKTELIPYGPKELQAMIASGTRNYDLIVIGVSVEASLSGIGQLFATSESKEGGVNFSSVENKALDTLFTELAGTTDAKKVNQIEKNIAKIMNTESFFVPISSPYHRIWVDRNIKGIPTVDMIPDISSFVDVFVETSIKDTYVRNTNKTISGFFAWLFTKL